VTAPIGNDDEALILASIDRFLEREVAPYAHELEATDTYPQAIVEQMKELGLSSVFPPCGCRCRGSSTPI
jgi:alkylation response protein AidB-like acyl-CoA dehydrogenase